jgi:type VI secretion system protein ImpC
MAEETKEKTKTEEAVETLDLKRFLSSMRLNVEVAEPVPMLQDELQTIAEEVSDEDRFISGLAALLMNIDTSVGRFDKGMAQEVIARIDLMVNDQINEIMHHPQF